ncbi:cysteinyl-tRNA synthetase, partial [Coemansia nantahalensis]
MPRDQARLSRNDYSYLLKERSPPGHSSLRGQPVSVPAPQHERPQTGQPPLLRDRVVHNSARAHDAVSTSAFSLHAPGSRQSHASIPAESYAAARSLTGSSSGTQVLRRADSGAPPRPAHERANSSANSIVSLSATSRWFRRGRNRSSSKQKEPAAGNYQLDMNFSDIGNFVDLAKVRRPSMASSHGTGDLSLNASNATGDSSKDDGGSGVYLAPPDGSLGGSPASRGRRRSQATSTTSPLLKEAVVGDARSIASSMRHGVQRMSSASSALNRAATPSQKSDTHAWPGDYRESSVKSRRPTTFSTDGDSEYEYVAPAANDHGSVQSAPMFESRPHMVHFTDPWASDRKRQQSLRAALAGELADGSDEDSVQRGASTDGLRGAADGAAGSIRGDAFERSGSSAVPEAEYPLRKSEPWAPPESWAVLPTGHDSGDEAAGAGAGAGAGAPKELVSDGECASSDSEIEDDNKMYSMRIYKEDSTFGTFHCRLSTTTADFMQMAAKKFFISDITRYCLYMQKANGLDRTLNVGERPANILKNYLEQMGYRPEDNITLQGREDNSYLCKFSLFKAAIPRVSPNMEVEVSSFQHIDLRARKLQAVPV